MPWILWTPQQVLPKLGAWYYLRDANGIKADGSQLTVDNNGNILSCLDASGNNKTLFGAAGTYPKFIPASTNIGSTKVPSISSSGSSILTRSETKIPVEIYSVNWCNGSGSTQFLYGAKRTTGTYIGDRLVLKENTILTGKAGIMVSTDAGYSTIFGNIKF